MRVPVLKTSFCGCSLRTGSLCIGYIYTFVVTLLATCLILMGIIMGDHQASALDFCLVVQLVVTILLLVGIYKRERSLIASWIIVSFVISIMVLLDSWYCFVLLVSAFHWIFGVLGGIFILTFGIQIYTILIVYSHYKEIAENYHRYSSRETNIQLA